MGIKFNPLINSGFDFTGSGGGGSSPSIGGTITGGTDKSVLFVHPADTISQDNANFNYDAPTETLTVTNIVTTTVTTPDAPQTLTITTANRTTTGNASELDISSGNATDGRSGDISIVTGDAGGTNKSSGDFGISTGSSTGSAARGSLDLSSGNTSISSDVQTYITAGTTIKLDANISAESHIISNVTDPVSAQDATTKFYVDSFLQGLSIKQSVLTATTVNITLSGEQTLDGVLTSASRVLVKNQTLSQNNGIYTTGAGAWTRTTDMNTWAEVPGTFVFVEQGSTQADTGWVCTSDPGGTLGTTPITWTQFSGPGSYTADGQGVKLTGTQFALSIDGTTLSQSVSGVKVATGGITNTEVAASAAITLTKLAALSTHNRALQSDNSGFITESTVTSTELGYVAGVTSAIQTQINTKVTGPASATDNAITRFDGTTGKLVQDSSASIDDSGNLTATNFSGSSSGTNTGDVTIGTANGLSIVGQALSLALSSTSTTGALSSTDWNTFNSKSSGVTGDISQTSFTAADNQSAAANVTGLAFSNAAVRSFEAQVSIVRSSTYAVYALRGIQKGASWDMAQDFNGDTTGLVFSITTAGQVQYTSTSTGSTATVKFRAWVTGP